MGKDLLPMEGGGIFRVTRIVRAADGHDGVSP
jgi:hypothetical protein